MPAGCFPILTDYDALPILPIFLQAISTILHIYAQTRQRYTLSAAELDALRRRLRSLYEAGPGVRSDEEDDGADDEESADDSGAHIPIPAETFLEELSQKLQIHPISVYWLLKEGIEQEGWRCPPEEKRLAEDRLTVLVLRLLGHRWPKQIEAGEALPAWADPDGIIPLVEGLGDAPLLERVQDLPPPPPSLKGKAGQGWEDGFAGMVGESLGAWLAGSFFRRHLSQFKKRPIAWQVVSTPAAGRKKGLRREPVVSLLLYYHKLDTGLLARLRAQYAAPLRQRHETELRTLESRALISPEQSARRLQLGEWIAELQAFEARVQQVEQSGFATPALRQQALEEALRCITAQWLAEVEARLRAAALPAWQEHAAAAHLHADLPAWLDEAFHDLSRLCTQVNPPGLPAERLAADPAAADFAAWLAPHEPALRAAALRLACARWQDRLDEAALKPLKEQIKTAGTNKASLRGQLKELEKRAERLSAEIQAWAGELPGEAWLAARPLYDQLSALDATRRPPQSLAEFVIQEGLYAPDLNDGVRVNIAPLQKAGLLAAEVLDAKDIEKAIADRAEWRGDERKWCREGKLPKPGWWK